MNRAQKYLSSLPNGTTYIKSIKTDMGIECIYISPDGKSHSLPSMSRYNYTDDDNK